MKRIIFVVIIVKIAIFFLYFISRNKENNKEIKNERVDKEIDYANLSNKQVNVTQLEKCKSEYPFKKWRNNGTEYGMEQYSEENCEAAEMIFDELIADLKTLPKEATAETKVIIFKYAVLATNSMDERIAGLIETGEREDLCELFDQISIAAGLEPNEFADGEGIASEWRDW